MLQPSPSRLLSLALLAGAALLTAACGADTAIDGDPLTSTIAIGPALQLGGAGRDTAEVTPSAGGITVDGAIQLSGECYQLAPTATKLGSELYVVVTTSRNGAVCPLGVFVRQYRVQVTGVTPGPYTAIVRHRLSEPNVGQTITVRIQSVVVP